MLDCKCIENVFVDFIQINASNKSPMQTISYQFKETCLYEGDSNAVQPGDNAAYRCESIVTKESWEILPGAPFTNMD